MRLFYAAGSSSLFPHIVLYEAELPFSAIKVDEHTKRIEAGGDYRTVNPLGYVPALILDDATLLTEGPRLHNTFRTKSPGRSLLLPMARLSERSSRLGSIFSRVNCTKVVSHRSSTLGCQSKQRPSSARGS
jgi:glutathione S-transferase